MEIKLYDAPTRKVDEVSAAWFCDLLVVWHSLADESWSIIYIFYAIK